MELGLRTTWDIDTETGPDAEFLQLLLMRVTEIQRQMLEGIVIFHLVKVSILKDRKHKLHREFYNAMPSDLA